MPWHLNSKDAASATEIQRTLQGYTLKNSIEGYTFPTFYYIVKTPIIHTFKSTVSNPESNISKQVIVFRENGSDFVIIHDQTDITRRIIETFIIN